MCSKEAANCRKEEEMMAAATLAREKEAAKRRMQEEAVAAQVTLTPTLMALGAVLPLVVSPPSAMNLNSLLTGHVGQESVSTHKDGIASTSMEEDLANSTDKITKNKKAKKVKSSKDDKEDKATKRNRRGLALKKGGVTSTAPAAPTSPPATKYKYAQVFYKAGLELKGEDKYGTYVKQIGNLLDNTQLVDPTTIMHAAVETDALKPIGKKEEMSANMTIFLAYAPVGKNQNAFKPKKNNNKKKGRQGKDEPEILDPSVYPKLVFLSDVDPETIVSRVMHEFFRAGGFNFQKKQLQCVETVTPFIIYYLYTFNDITTLCAELMDLLKRAFNDLESKFMIPEEFQHSTIPEINICQGIPKLPGQPGSQFQDYS
jgi:hypothetical protein